MYVSTETTPETDYRLRQVAAATSVRILDGEWQFEEFPAVDFVTRARHDALAIVRDEDRYSQLVPAPPDGSVGERCRIWSCHFPAGVDNSGFVGWLASLIKRETGSGVLVVCGQNADRGGIFDYWGCPTEAAERVLSTVVRLTSPASPLTSSSASAASLAGLRMRPIKTSPGSVITVDTLFEFTQLGDVVFARYAGGTIVLGVLAGIIDGLSLTFRYAQIDEGRQVQGGRSECQVSRSADGRLQLTERFTWESDAGSGVNVLETVD